MSKMEQEFSSMSDMLRILVGRMNTGNTDTHPTTTQEAATYTRGLRGRVASLENAHSNDETNGEEPLLQNEHQHNNTSNRNINSSEKRFKLSDIPVHGDTLTRKANNTMQILFKNVDGFVVRDKTDRNKSKNK